VVGVEAVVVPGVGDKYQRMQEQKPEAIVAAIREMVEVVRRPGAGATPATGTQPP